MTRRIAYLMSVMALGAAVPSQGQERTGTSGLPELVVLDCTNVSSYQGHLLSWRAADALSLAISAQGRWAVVPRRQVRREIEARGLSVPLSPAHAQLLGDVLDASFGLLGTIRSCDVSDEGAKVTLALAVDLIDVRSGDVVVSETTEGTARAADDRSPTIDVQVGEALAQAAEAAARKVPAFQHVKGMVYALLGKRQAYINLGREHGLKKGAELTVYRESYDEEARGTKLTLVGRVKVMEVGPTDSTTRIMNGSKPLQREDVIQTLLPVVGPEEMQPR